MKTIYTLGYSGLSPADLLRLAETRDLVVLDIRYSPRSRRPEWTRARLSALLGARYVHLPELGNVNYRGDGPIVLADPAQGVQRAAAYLAQRDVLLLCACRDLATCHRLPASELLAEATGASLQHLTPADLCDDDRPGRQRPGQLSLWED
jgi:hypothetical protein